MNADRQPLHLIEKVAGAWYIWPAEGDRRNGTRILRTAEAIAGPFPTRTRAMEGSVLLMVKESLDGD